MDDYRFADEKFGVIILELFQGNLDILTYNCSLNERQILEAWVVSDP